MTPLAPLTEFYRLGKRGSLVFLAFGAYIQDDKVVVPAAEVKAIIAKGTTLKFGKIRVKLDQEINPQRDPFLKFTLSLKGEPNEQK